MEITAQYFVIICIALIAAITIGWASIFFFLRKQDAVLKSLLTEGLILRLLTVVFIIAGAGMLALADKLTGEVATILSGVAGYVLGGTKKGKSGEKKERQP